MDGGIVLWFTLVAFTYLQVCVVARDIAHSKGCLTGQVWDSRVGVCSTAHLRLWRRLHLLANPCAGIANSYGFLESHSKDCRCRVGYDWVAANRSCQLNCKKISNSDGAASNINGKCNCKPSFTFINGTLPRCKRTCKTWLIPTKLRVLVVIRAIANQASAGQRLRIRVSTTVPSK
jgi:hypothetical protein